MKQKKFNIAVIYGSVRSDRQGIKAARFIVNKLMERGHKTNLVDPREFKLPLLDKMYKEYPKGKAPETLEKLAKIMKRADAYVIVSAEYNHAPPAALKNTLDHFLGEAFFKPSAIVTYSAGPFGGIRAAMHWRSILPEMGMSPIPSEFPISRVQDSFNDKGHALDKSYNKRVIKFLDELEWYAEALKNQREKGTPY